MGKSNKPDYQDATSLTGEDLTLNRADTFGPYHSRVWRDGELHTVLNPADQQRLDANRAMLHGVGNAAGGGKKGPQATGQHQPGFEPGNSEVGVGTLPRSAVPRGRNAQGIEVEGEYGR